MNKFSKILMIFLSLTFFSVLSQHFFFSQSVSAASIFDNPRLFDEFQYVCNNAEGHTITGLDFNIKLSYDIENSTGLWQDKGIYSLSDVYDPDRFYWAFSVTNNTTTSQRQLSLILIEKSDVVGNATFKRFTTSPSLFYSQTTYAIPVVSNFEPFEYIVKTSSTGTNCKDTITSYINANPSWSANNYESSQRYYSLGAMFPDYRGSSSAIMGLYLSTVPFSPPIGYEGPEIPSQIVPPKQEVYPGISIVIKPNTDASTSKVKLLISDEYYQFMEENNLPPTSNVIFAITDMSDEIIIPDKCWGPSGCDWNTLPNGDYKARLSIIYTDPSVTDKFDFKTTEVWFQVNGEEYSLIYNQKENRYCTVRNGFEWNCQIPQPGQTPSLIDGTPESWTEEECTIDGFPYINLGGCIRNSMHYLLEYLGINGPGITPGASIFFQQDPNTFGLTSILTSPLTILNNLSLAEYTCVPVELPLPFMESDLSLPCMHSYYTNYMGDLFLMWQTVINGIVAYYVVAGLLRMVKEAKDPQEDKIEVVKL